MNRTCHLKQVIRRVSHLAPYRSSQQPIRTGLPAHPDSHGHSQGGSLDCSQVIPDLQRKHDDDGDEKGEVG